MSSFVENVNITAALLSAIDPAGIAAVAANEANITLVATDIANVNTVAGINTDVTTVAAHATNVDTTATNIGSVNTVATNIDGVLFTASNMAAVIAAPTHAAIASNMANSATSAATLARIAADSASSSAGSASASKIAAQLSADSASGSAITSKYWADQAAFYVTSGVIIDSITSATKTWSSSKINTQIGTKENSLGNPASNGYILSSTTGGTRTWIAAPSTLPTVQTNSATSVAATSFTANGQITTFTGFDNSTTEVRFSYGTDTAGSNIGQTTWTSKADLTAFTASITGLTSATTYYFKAQMRDTNRPDLGTISGNVVSQLTASEVAGTTVNITGASTGGGVTAFDGTSVPTLTNGTIISNEFVANAASGSATTYEFNQANTTKMAPSIDISPFTVAIDGTSTASVPVVTSGTDNLFTTGAKLWFDDTVSVKEVIAGTVTKTTVSTTITVSAQSEADSSSQAWKAFDSTTTGEYGNAWQSNTGLPQWLKTDFGISVIANGYRITARSASNRMPTAWTFEGSNDNSSWTTLDTRTAQSPSSSAGGTVYTFTNTTAYRYYRLNISASTASDVAITDFNIRKDGADLIPVMSGYTVLANLAYKYSIASVSPTLSNNPTWGAIGGQKLQIGTSATTGTETYADASGARTVTRATNNLTLSYAEQAVTANYFKFKALTTASGDKVSKFYATTKHG